MGSLAEPAPRASLYRRRFTGKAERGRAARLSRPALLSLLLHAMVLAALVIGLSSRRREAFVPPAPIAVVFEHGGAPRATAPKTLRHGPPTAAARPEAVPALPLPLPPAAPAQSDVAVRLSGARGLQAFLQPQPLPPPAPLRLLPPAPRPPSVHRPVPPALSPDTLFMPAFSFGAAAPPHDTAPRRGLDLALSRPELQRAFAPDFAVEGKIGPDWQAALRRWVDQRKYYPASALAMEQQGRVEIRLVIAADGAVIAANLLHSSGSPFLDSAWLGLFRGQRVPPFPPGTREDRIIIRATMHYILID